MVSFRSVTLGTVAHHGQGRLRGEDEGAGGGDHAGPSLSRKL